jgi:hypothetical protein
VFRIGIHVGEVPKKVDGTVYSNGANFAARVLAKAAIVVVAQTVFSTMLARGARLAMSRSRNPIRRPSTWSPETTSDPQGDAWTFHAEPRIGFAFAVLLGYSSGVAQERRGWGKQPKRAVRRIDRLLLRWLGRLNHNRFRGPQYLPRERHSLQDGNVSA